MSTTTPNLGLTVPAMGDQISSTIPALGTNFQTLDNQVGTNTNQIGILLKNTFNVLTYGADPTGAVDSTTAIQNAITAAGSTGDIYLPAGTYLISGTLNLASYQRMRGAGKMQSIIKPNGAFPAIAFNGNATTGCYYSEISDVKIDGNATATAGINFNYARECFVNDVYITNCVKGVITTQAWSNAIRSSEIVLNTDTNVELNTNSNDFNLIDVQLDHAGNYGIHIMGGDSQAINIIGCCIQSCGKDGILIDAGRAITITGCYFEQNNTSNTASCGDIHATGTIATVVGLVIVNAQLWSKSVQASILLDHVYECNILGISASLVSGGTSAYALQTSTNTSSVFVVGAYLSGLGYSDASNTITRIENKYLYNFGWQTNTTANRPVSPFAGQPFLDTTVNRPIWRNSANNKWISADGTPPENRGVNVSVTTGATSQATGLSYAETDTSYGVIVTPSWNTAVWITGKLTTGFTINFGTAAPSGGTVDWFIKR